MPVVALPIASWQARASVRECLARGPHRRGPYWHNQDAGMRDGPTAESFCGHNPDPRLPV